MIEEADGPGASAAMAKAIKKNKKAGQKNNQKSVSLLELNEKAHERVEAIRRANAAKSQAKIKELTAEHQKKKAQKGSGDGDVVMDSDDAEESKENAAAKAKNGKPNGKGRREPLDGKAVNKGMVVASKLANKRSQKEAIKKNKMKRNKGTFKDESSTQTKGAKAAASSE